MLRTRELLRKHVHNDIVAIVISYVQSTKRTWKSIAEAGEYETCLEIPTPARGANDWNEGLSGACYGGHKELAPRL
jgi:hypothetical protein